MKAKSWAAGLAVSMLLCNFAGAEAWYRWVDADGIPHFDRQPPMSATQYELFQVPDPVRWSSPPEIPAEIAAEATITTQNLFKTTSQSIYRVLGTVKNGLRSELRAFGSAVAIKEHLAITNCHVIGAAGDVLSIGASGTEAVERAELVAVDFIADRCVLGVREMHLHPVAGIRRYDTLEIGETVYAIGNPRSMERTLSNGLVSGKRTIEGARFLQTTAPISPGSSGGGLFDERGNLVAITSMSLRGAQNINFAIPAEDFWK